MRALSASIVVLSGAICVVADVQSSHLTSDHWGLLFGVPVSGVGLIGWLGVLFRGRDDNYRPTV